MFFSVLILGMWGWAQVEKAAMYPELCTKFAEFLASGTEHHFALPTLWPGQHTAGTAKCELANL